MALPVGTSLGVEPTPMKAIVLDESQDTLLTAERRLGHGGYEVLCLSKWSELSAQTAIFKPDVVVCAANMAGLSGADAIGTIKRFWPAIACVLICDDDAEAQSITIGDQEIPLVRRSELDAELLLAVRGAVRAQG